MITSAQRARLRSLAQNVNPIFQIGKNGIGDNQVKDICLALELHELVKISVLRNAETPTKVVLDEICRLTGAEPVTAIGNKVVIYKRSTRDDVEHIEI
ncbi:MAG: YhbY family RNA-binding protein [Christensenellales bacterium]